MTTKQRLDARSGHDRHFRTEELVEQSGRERVADPTGPLIHIRIDHDTWKAILRRAGVRDARLHDARHTAATMLLVLGIPQRAVMDVMGWSEASMAARYQHVADEVVTGIADRVGGLYSEAEEEPQGTDDQGGETAV